MSSKPATSTSSGTRKRRRVRIASIAPIANRSLAQKIELRRVLAGEYRERRPEAVLITEVAPCDPQVLEAPPRQRAAESLKPFRARRTIERTCDEAERACAACKKVVRDLRPGACVVSRHRCHPGVADFGVKRDDGNPELRESGRCPWRKHRESADDRIDAIAGESRKDRVRANVRCRLAREASDARSREADWRTPRACVRTEGCTFRQ